MVPSLLGGNEIRPVFVESVLHHRAAKASSFRGQDQNKRRRIGKALVDLLDRKSGSADEVKVLPAGLRT